MSKPAPLILAAAVAAVIAAVIGIGRGGPDPAPGSPPPPSAGATVPPVPAGELAPEVAAALVSLARGLDFGLSGRDLAVLVASGDPRLSWVVVDLLYFLQDAPEGAVLVQGFAELTGAGVDPSDPWRSASDRLLAWDLPAPPGYPEWKRSLLLRIEPRWDRLLTDDAEVDWRWLNWGGVRIDDRPAGDPDRCPRGCIPALDDPAVTPAGGGGWYPDDGVVFGVVVGGEARAYPRHVMEVHELVNDTLGGRRIGVPYCTLCGSAQAYLLDGGAEPLVLRTSGLLSRSNKVMYDLGTGSLIDTFTGRALSGPLAAAGVTLPMVSVVTTTWGEWRTAHPGTTIVARDGGIGRTYPADPLGGRDDGGPIFPVGTPDPRLGVHDQVLGVVTGTGRAVAFPASRAAAHLVAGGEIEVDDVRLVLDGGGLRAERADGSDPGAHQAFWFAWSQFHPGTEVWPDLGP